MARGDPASPHPQYIYPTSPQGSLSCLKFVKSFFLLMEQPPVQSIWGPSQYKLHKLPQFLMELLSYPSLPLCLCTYCDHPKGAFPAWQMPWHPTYKVQLQCHLFQEGFQATYSKKELLPPLCSKTSTKEIVFNKAFWCLPPQYNVLSEQRTSFINPI